MGAYHSASSGGDTVTFTMNRQSAKDLIVALTHALASGDSKKGDAKVQLVADAKPKPKPEAKPYAQAKPKPKPEAKPK